VKRNQRRRKRELNLEHIELLLGRTTAVCLALLVVCQLYLSHPQARSLLHFLDAPEGQAWSVDASAGVSSGWLTLTASPPEPVAITLNGNIAGTLSSGQLTLQVRDGEILGVNAHGSQQAVVVRVGSSYRLRFPARGAWIRVPAGQVVEWGQCSVHK